MSWTQITANYSEASSVGTLTLSALTLDQLYYTTLQGYTLTGSGGTLSSTSWFITWDQTTSTVGYANGVAPTIPSEIYVGGYLVTSGNIYNDVWNFVLKPNGIWTLTVVKATTSTTHPTEAFFVGYDNVNNLTYTKQVSIA